MKTLLTILVLIIFPTVSLAGEIKLMIPKMVKDTEAQGYYKPAFRWGAPYLKGMIEKDISRKYEETDLTEFVQKFEGKEYKVDQIELWIEGKAEEGEVTKLFISFEGSGGVKVLLKPDEKYKNR